MSRLKKLLESSNRLEASDVEDLKSWLKALEEDCELFGETVDDTRTMRAIKNKLEVYEANNEQEQKVHDKGSGT